MPKRARGTVGAPAPRRKCPKCKSALIAAVAYGLRSEDPTFMGALARGEVVLVEADIPAKNPAWACRACGHLWGRGG
jgi:hypothetical protein